MSRLPNAPLKEVIFELKWDLKSKEDLQQMQFLYGSIYNQLKAKYPIQVSLHDPLVPQELLIHKALFQLKGDTNFPLVQIGPGVVTLNSNDFYYFSDDFKFRAGELVDNLFKVANINSSSTKQLDLIYIDFFEFDFEKNNILDYMKSNLHVDISQTIFNAGNPNQFSLQIGYLQNNKEVQLFFQKGVYDSNQLGLVVHTIISQKFLDLDTLTARKWLNEAHSLTRDLFMRMTEGNLYSSFQ